MTTAKNLTCTTSKTSRISCLYGTWHDRVTSIICHRCCRRVGHHHACHGLCAHSGASQHGNMGCLVPGLHISLTDTHLAGRYAARLCARIVHCATPVALFIPLRKKHCACPARSRTHAMGIPRHTLHGSQFEVCPLDWKTLPSTYLIKAYANIASLSLACRRGYGILYHTSRTLARGRRTTGQNGALRKLQRDALLWR